MKRRQEANAASSTPGGAGPTPSGASPTPGATAGKPKANEFDTIDNKRAGANVEMNDINIDVGENSKQQEGIGPGPARAAPGPSTDDEDEDGEDVDGYDDAHLPFFSQIVNRYPKSINWFFMVVTFCAMRAGTPFAIALVYLSLISRAVQIVGTFVNKPLVAYIGYGASSLMLTILFFVAMAHEND